MNTPTHTPLHTHPAQSVLVACPACGTPATRHAARFCRVCGRKLDAVNDYAPTDALRASYHAHHQVEKVNMETVVRRTPRQSRAHTFNRHDNQAAHLALAFVAFALVPYLGILFCPGAFIAGCAGVRRARLAPHHGGRVAAVFGIVAALVIAGAQVFLWWLFYKIPS